jgi:hypothetical protein
MAAGGFTWAARHVAHAGQVEATPKSLRQRPRTQRLGDGQRLALRTLVALAQRAGGLIRTAQRSPPGGGFLPASRSLKGTRVVIRGFRRSVAHARQPQPHQKFAGEPPMRDALRQRKPGGSFACGIVVAPFKPGEFRVREMCGHDTGQAAAAQPQRLREGLACIRIAPPGSQSAEHRVGAQERYRHRARVSDHLAGGGAGLVPAATQQVQAGCHRRLHQSRSIQLTLGTPAAAALQAGLGFIQAQQRGA